MIQIYCGVPGSGKSYDSVRTRFIPAFKSGRIIWTNIEGLDLEYICSLENISQDNKINVKILSDDQVLTFYESVPDGAIVIIDEAQNYWSSKDYRTVPREFDKFLSMHRHHGIDLIFLTQRPQRVYKEIQRLAEYVWKFEKMGWLGLSTRYKAACYLGVDERRSFSRQVRQYVPKYFRCYKSYSTVDIKEQKVESTAIFKKWHVVSVAVFLVFTFYKFVNLPWFFGKDEALAAVEKSQPLETAGGEKIFLQDQKKISSVTDPKREKIFSVKDGDIVFEKETFNLTGLVHVSGGFLYVLVNEEYYLYQDFRKKFDVTAVYKNGTLCIQGDCIRPGQSFTVELSKELT